MTSPRTDQERSFEDALELYGQDHDEGDIRSKSPTPDPPVRRRGEQLQLEDQANAEEPMVRELSFEEVNRLRQHVEPDTAASDSNGQLAQISRAVELRNMETESSEEHRGRRRAESLGQRRCHGRNVPMNTTTSSSTTRSTINARKRAKKPSVSSSVKRTGDVRESDQDDSSGRISPADDDSQITYDLTGCSPTPSNIMPRRKSRVTPKQTPFGDNTAPSTSGSYSTTSRKRSAKQCASTPLDSSSSETSSTDVKRRRGRPSKKSTPNASTPPTEPTEDSASSTNVPTSSTIVYNTFTQMEDGHLVELEVDNSAMERSLENQLRCAAIDKMADDIKEYFDIPATYKQFAAKLARSKDDSRYAFLERLEDLKERIETLQKAIKHFDDFEYGPEDRLECWSQEPMSSEEREKRVSTYEKANLEAVRLFIDEKIGDIKNTRLVWYIDDALKGIRETVSICETYREKHPSEEYSFSFKDDISLVDVAERKEGTKKMFEKAISKFPTDMRGFSKQLATPSILSRIKKALESVGLDVKKFQSDFLKIGSPEGFLSHGPYYNRLLLNLASQFFYSRSTGKWRMMGFDETEFFNKIPFDVQGNAIVK